LPSGIQAWPGFPTCISETPSFGPFSLCDFEICSPTVTVVLITVLAACAIVVKTIRGKEMLSYWERISLILCCGFTCIQCTPLNSCLAHNTGVPA
jgi:hypothetical protein